MPVKPKYCTSALNPLMKWPVEVPVLSRDPKHLIDREECLLFLQEIMEPMREFNPPARFDVMMRILNYTFNVLDWHQAYFRNTYNQIDVFNAVWYRLGYNHNQCPKGKQLALLRFHD